jgi:Tfp pilus assembly protein PilX
MTGNTGQKGVALILALIFMIVLSVMTGSYVFLVNRSLHLANAQHNDARSFYLAEAGLNKGVWYLMNTAPDGTTGGSWRTSSYPAAPGPDADDPQQESLGDGRYVIWVENNASNTRITARGEVNGVFRTVRQDFSGFSPVVVVEDSWREI